MKMGKVARPALRVALVSAIPWLALAVLLTGCQRSDEGPPPEIRPVRALTIQSAQSSGSIALTGRVQAQSEVNQSFRLDGQLIERTVDVGDTVTRGQLLARLDSQNEESALQAAQAQVAAAQAQLVDAQGNFTRMSDLIGENAISRAAYENADAMLKTAQAQARAVGSQLTLARNRLDFTRLLADVDGIVTARGAEAGEVVSAGRMIVQIAQSDARDAVFDVPARIVDGGLSDPEVTVALTSDPTVTAQGRVREVSPRADPVTGTFQVRVGLSEPPAAMRLGSTVTGRLQMDAALSMEIPAAALIRSDAGSAVWVVDPEAMTVQARAVQIEANDSRSVRVASGLAAGDIVVIAGVQALRPGQKVRVLETPAP
jgi:RND family efflux transporter MFP subunit